MAIIFILSITNRAYCQSIPALPADSLSYKANPADTLYNADTLLGYSRADSLKKDSSGVGDTSKSARLERELGIKISKEAMHGIVKATAQDSAVFNMAHNLFYLYGKAQVNYEDLQLKAGQITFEQNTSTVSASARGGDVPDTSAEGKQTFTQGKEKLIFDSLQYNFKSNRAIVRNVHSQYGEGYMYSEQVKRNPDQTLYAAHSVYTTCALDTPHFGIVAFKTKAIPQKAIVTGPCNLVIMGVPTPLWLPFGIFPVSQTQKSGFIIPSYSIEEARGLGLLNGGYYVYVNDHVDLLTQANIFTKGSYALSEVSTYNNIYHYRGSVNFSYAYNKTGEDFEPGATTKKDFIFNWRHQSDAKAVPGQSFNASVQVGSSSFYSNNSYDPNQILQNQYQSNVSYSKTWQGTPFGLTVSALHNQNTATKQINVTLPDVNFHVTQINPFQNKKRVGVHWFDKITASYTFDLLNRTTFYDSTFSRLLNNLSLSQFQNGVHHTLPVSASYTILRYVNMSFSINYNEYWYTQKLYQQYSDADRKTDSVQNYGFYTARDFNAGVTFSTRIYGMKLFKQGRLRGIRHVITPSVGLTYHPDFGASPYNFYYRSRTDSINDYAYLSPFATSIIGLPPLGKAGLVSFGINNNLQIKVKSAKDTVSGSKNVTLIDALGIGATYNPAADSFQWSNIGINFRTNVLDKVNISAASSYDPYGFDYSSGRRLPQLLEQTGNGFARFTNATVSLGANFRSRPKTGANKLTSSEEYTRLMRNAGYNDYVDFNVPWSFNFSYSLSANKNYSPYFHNDTLVYNQTLTFQGEVQITSRWKLNVTSGYNFDYHELTLTSIDIYRDLHCWAMHLQTVPFGPRKSFNFTINVKSAVLQDLKLTRRRDYRDSPY